MFMFRVKSMNKEEATPETLNDLGADSIEHLRVRSTCEQRSDAAIVKDGSRMCSTMSASYILAKKIFA